MENLHVTWETLLAIAGGVVLFMNAVKAIVQLFDPFRELKKKQEEQEHYLKNDKERLDKLEKDMDSLHEAISVVGRALSEMINHEVTGNDVKELEEQRKILDDYFYKGGK